MKRPHTPIWVAVALIACLAPPLAACGPMGIGVYFWPPHQPGPAHESFLRGQLGILDSELGTAYHYVAYRYLAALETGLVRDAARPASRQRRAQATNPEALASLWPAPATQSAKNLVTVWREARAEVPGVEPLGWFSRSRHVAVEEGDNTLYSYFFNCLDDALFTAAATLEARIERFGAASREVRAWLVAQDQVFANCDDGESIPAPLDAGWDPLIRADRAYQIAAAHFYATRYAGAAELFRAIARDGESPWRELSAYLVARALIRDGHHAEAGEQLNAVLADPDLGAIHEPARRLLAYSDLRSDPEIRRRELNERLLATELEAPLRQDFIDYMWLLDHHAGSDELGPWLCAMEKRTVDGEQPRAVAAGRWRQEPSSTWLVAALVAADPVAADPDSPDIEPLLEAAAELPPESPAYLTAAYHRSRLLVGLGHAEAARAVLDPLLDQPPGELSAADRNRLSLLRAEVTPDLPDYLRLVTLVPAGLGWDDGTDELIRMDGGRSFPYYRHGDPILPDSAVELLNHGLSTEEMFELAEADLLPEPWRRRLSLAVWTRAVTTDNDVVALAAAPLVSSLAPELAAEMAAFTAADAGDRRFEAAWTMLRFPGLSPVLRWNVGRSTPIDQIDNLRANGWCDAVLQAEAVPKQIVRTPEQIATVQASLAASPSGATSPGRPSGATLAWPDYTGRVVLSHAQTHPGEPRLAEALHRVVKATRIGCPMGSYGNVSRAAFQLLHRRFPSSPWTRKTPYWFD